MLENLEKLADFKQGENVQQSASLYKTDSSINWELLNGNELTYKNYVNMSSMLDILSEFFDVFATAVTKSGLICSVALGKTLVDSFAKAVDSNPIGAIDSEGKYTTDSNNGLNCSGFIKWIADGFYMPIRKQNNELPLYMSLQALRTKHPNSRGDRYTNLFEDIRDPYFGLDWTRNIAISLANLRDKKNMVLKILIFVIQKLFLILRTEDIQLKI